jgi:hypothetical protein
VIFIMVQQIMWIEYCGLLHGPEDCGSGTCGLHHGPVHIFRIN